MMHFDMRWVVSIISLLFALGISEIFLRMFHPAPSVVRFLLGQKGSSYELSDNPVLGYKLRANVRSDKPDCHHTFDYTNNDGQRDIERSREKVAGKRRVIMLGDSVVAGHGTCRVDDTISRKLETLYTDNSVEVLNFGVGGYCTRAEVELLKVKGLSYKPDEVYVVFVSNDYVNSNGAIVNQIRTPRPEWSEFAFQRSHLFRWSGLKFNLFGFRNDFDPAARIQRNAQAIGDDNVEEGLALLATLAAENNFKVKIFLWPSFTDRHIDEPWPLGHEAKDEKLPVELVADTVGLKTYRLSNAFFEDLEILKR